MKTFAPRSLKQRGAWRALAVKEYTAPALEEKEAPDHQALVGALLVACQHVANVFRLDEFAEAASAREQRARNVIAQLAAEPRLVRRRETLLPLVDRFLRQQRREGALQEIFRHAVAHFRGGRHPRTELHELVIEKGETRFNAEGHAELV